MGLWLDLVGTLNIFVGRVDMWGLFSLSKWPKTKYHPKNSRPMVLGDLLEMLLFVKIIGELDIEKKARARVSRPRNLKFRSSPEPSDHLPIA